MSIYDKRLDAVEKDVTVMKRDIIYKLDDTNSAVGIIRGVMGAMAQDVKIIKSQIKTMDIQLDGIDTRLARFEEQQNIQGQDIKDINRRLDTFDSKLDQILQLLNPPPKTDK
jgi:cob(I)alamin adenosyltransferase